jgi:hypothetical protein
MKKAWFTLAFIIKKAWFIATAVAFILLGVFAISVSGSHLRDRSSSRRKDVALDPVHTFDLQNQAIPSHSKAAGAAAPS